ncbi:DNA-binding XRE family transcriptional regulator [Rhizobium sp. ERR 922]|uniref:helix-turn-helix transcriptional regulator n=1 Tax=unclassified Rhizobium TaxID=2613769 RepID=UPI00119EE9EE|nr:MULTISPECIES: helix-turn-helix transcriptional regulator [unclassified Rhizobium]TWB50057.1 DNA-binding XRE family transcriptional regulator [Rhizobium sp. ERR 922]TWB92438.1 DNA-binding XRE family transcriptional regulator [Rhizobium sp. ERR 942]
MLSEALRLIRVFHDLKQVELAEKLGISKSHLSEIESGTKTPSLEIIERYSKNFGIPVSSIMFFAENIEDAEKGKKAKAYIATKVINFLQLIEKNSSHAA